MTIPTIKPLYWIAGVLLVLRFVLVPWVAWMSDQHQTLEVLTKRLDRSEGVVEHRKEIEQSAADLRVVLQSLHERYPQASSVEEFKLAAQQRITAVLSEGALRAEVFDWIVDRFDDPPFVARVRARVQVNGTVQSLALVQGRLEATLPNLVVRDVRIESRAPTKTPSNTPASLSLTADLYFRDPVQR